MPRVDSTPLRALLRSIEIDRVDFCAAGSNGESDIVLFKSMTTPPHQGAPPMPTLPNVKKTEADQVAELQAVVDAAVAKAIEAKDAEHAAQIEAIKSLAPEGEPEVDPVEKAKADAVAEAVAVEKAKLDAALDDIAKMKADAAEAVYVTKAAALPLVNVEGVDLAKTMKGIADASPELVAEVEKVLTAANERLKASGLLKEIGGPGSGEPAEGQDALVEAAKALMAEDDSLSLAQATSKAIKENPALMAEYRKSFKTSGAE